MLNFCLIQVHQGYVFMLLFPNTECKVTLTEKGSYCCFAVVAIVLVWCLVCLFFFFHHKELQHSETSRIL